MLFSIFLILLGSLLIGLTVNSFGDIGNTLMKIIGIICVVLGIRTIIKKNKT
jgi:uncharacterized membrane protein YqgA involved in biofilm formation